MNARTNADRWRFLCENWNRTVAGELLSERFPALARIAPIEEIADRYIDYVEVLKSTSQTVQQSDKG